MQEMFEDIDKALGARAYYLALMGALAVPDICGSMDHKDGKANRERYIAWFDKWMGNRYSGFLEGAQCFAFRCGMLHQGSSVPHFGQYRRLLFLEPDPKRPRVHLNVLIDALNIELPEFCGDMIHAARNWLAVVQGTQPFETHRARLIRRHPQGLPPYLSAPLIG